MISISKKVDSNRKHDRKWRGAATTFAAIFHNNEEKCHPPKHQQTIPNKHENNAKKVRKWSRSRYQNSSTINGKTGNEINHESQEKMLFLICKNTQVLCKNNRSKRLVGCVCERKKVLVSTTYQKINQNPFQN